MRSRLSQTAYSTCLAILGVLLTISFIGYLCAENVATGDFIPSEITIQRLPPVENAATYPPYGFQGYNTGTPQVPVLAPPIPALNPPIPSSVAPSPAPQAVGGTTERLPALDVSDATPAAGAADAKETAEKLPTPESQEGKPEGEEGKKGEKEDKKEEETGEAVNNGMSTGPLGLITVSEELAWVNEVRPDSMLVRATRYLSRYVEDWDGSVQLGLDGTSGSSETFNSAFGINGKRKFELATFQFDIDYKRSTSEGVATADRLFFNCRYECPCNEVGWNFFVQDEVTYDEFQPWNVQVALSSGVGYYLWKKETSHLQALWGGGFSQDIGGPDDEYVPEMHLGLNGEHRINKRQKLVVSCNYYPDATDFSSSRIINKASWEVLLDEEVNLSMKFNVTDRMYNPNPGGQPNDLDYSVLLMWKF